MPTGQLGGMHETEEGLTAGLEGVGEGDEEDDEEEVEVEALDLTEAQVEAVCEFSCFVFVCSLAGAWAFVGLRGGSWDLSSFLAMRTLLPDNCPPALLSFPHVRWRYSGHVLTFGQETC